MAVDRAREANMPMETIQRAIQRGVGGAEGAALQEVVYEAYGAGGAAILVEATTDNGFARANSGLALFRQGDLEAARGADYCTGKRMATAPPRQRNGP